MKISDLLQESQNAQIQEGPLTRAVGQVGGKIAKGAAAIGKDLKTGFQQGYSGQKPAAEPEAAAAEPAAGDQAPAAKPGLVGKIKQAASDFKQGFQQGSGKPAAPAAPEQEKAAAPAAPAAEPAAKEEPAAPAADNSQADQSAKTIAQLQKQLTAAEERIQKLNDDVMYNLSGLQRRIVALEKSSQGENPNIVQSNNSVEPTGKSVTESIQLFRK